MTTRILDNSMSHRPRRRGMTLIEIMVVIAIIAILGAAVTIVARGALGSSKEKQTALTMKVLENVLTTYKGERKRFPRDPYVLQPPPGSPLPPITNGRMLKNNKPYVAETIGFLPGTGAGSYLRPILGPKPNYWPVDEGRGFGEFAEHLTVMMQSAECKKTLLSLEGSALQRRLRVAGGAPDRQVWTVVDAWGHELLYRIFERENNGFPILLSAGPDETYATADDIRSDGKPVKVTP